MVVLWIIFICWWAVPHLCFDIHLFTVIWVVWKSWTDYALSSGEESADPLWIVRERDKEKFLKDADKKELNQQESIFSCFKVIQNISLPWKREEDIAYCHCSLQFTSHQNTYALWQVGTYILRLFIRKKKTCLSNIQFLKKIGKCKNKPSLAAVLSFTGLYTLLSGNTFTDFFQSCQIYCVHVCTFFAD